MNLLETITVNTMSLIKWDAIKPFTERKKDHTDTSTQSRCCNFVSRSSCGVIYTRVKQRIFRVSHGAVAGFQNKTKSLRPYARAWLRGAFYRRRQDNCIDGNKSTKKSKWERVRSIKTALTYQDTILHMNETYRFSNKTYRHIPNFVYINTMGIKN